MPGDSQVFKQELAAFMYAIGQQESGGRYHILGPQTKYGRPRGKYQILDSNWDSWARNAGIPGADWRDPQAQERVASHMFSHYYNQFGGRWDAVAVAWFAGPGRAKKWIENPRSVTAMADVLGTSVGKYVEKAMRGMRNALGRDPMEFGFQDFSAAAYEVDAMEEEEVSSLEAAHSVMDSFLNMFGRDPTAPESNLNVNMSDEHRNAAISDVSDETLRETTSGNLTPRPSTEPSFSGESEPVMEEDIAPELRQTTSQRGVR